MSDADDLFDDLLDSFFPPESLNLGESCEDLMYQAINKTLEYLFKCKNCKFRRNRKAERDCVETERKFLVNKLPDLKEACGVYVLQGYIASEKETRLRIEDGVHYTFSIKGEGTLIRKEYETELSKEQFECLWPAVDCTLEKYRYCIPHNKYMIELSIYIGLLKGLVIAEIEFSSEEEAKNFQPPDWLGKDVTENPKYKNKNLAGKEFSNEY